MSEIKDSVTYASVIAEVFMSVPRRCIQLIVSTSSLVSS
jgi:hypothetical protein